MILLIRFMVAYCFFVFFFVVCIVDLLKVVHGTFMQKIKSNMQKLTQVGFVAMSYLL